LLSNLFQKLPSKINAMLLLAFSISLDRQRYLSSDEDLRKLDNGITELVEKVNQLRQYATVLLGDRLRFDPNHLLNYVEDVANTTNFCKNSYANYIAKKS